MPRAQSLLLALSLAFVLTPAGHCAESEIDTPGAQAGAYYRALHARDVRAIAPILHADSLRYHRRYVEIGLLKLEERFGAAAVEAILGKSRADLSALGDEDFFCVTVRCAWEIAGASPAPRETLPALIGAMPDGKRVHTLARVGQSFEGEGQRVEFDRIDTLCFAPEGETWKLVSFPLAVVVIRACTDELLKAAKSAAP